MILPKMTDVRIYSLGTLKYKHEKYVSIYKGDLKHAI